MAVKTERLRVYLARAWRETQDPVIKMHGPPADFARNDTWYEPTLRSDQTNHIITYAGAFNPPHKGHVDLIADSLQNSGPGLNIVAAFVIPISDERLRVKEDNRKGPGPSQQSQIIFSQGQRAALLTTHLKETENLMQVACKINVWNFPNLHPFRGHMGRVAQLAAADGFDVEFISIKGPDHLVFHKPIKHPALLDARKILFSEVARVSEGAWGPNGQPTLLKGGWSQWSKISSVTGSNGVTRSVWESTLASPVGSAVRLLATDDNKDGKPEVSSTAIRKVIMQSPEGMGVMGLDALADRLGEAGAISPHMLAKFIMEGKSAQ